MILADNIKIELIRAVTNLTIAFVTLGSGWLVGRRLTVYWNIRQKRRELDLATAGQFYRLYGEFYVVWKLWNYYIEEGLKDLKLPEKTRWDLLNRASSAEAGIESIFIKISSERKLSDADVEALGKFRQAYQTLRESIRDNRPVNWYYHEHPEYLAFKNLACYVSNMLSSDEKVKMPSPEQSSKALKDITSNKWENNWYDRDISWEDRLSRR